MSILQAYCDRNCALLLAPIFPGGRLGPSDLSSYKILRTADLEYDTIFVELLRHVEQRWDVDSSKVDLVGFSGGAQFVHRFTYVHPERVRSLCLVAPGSVTLIDDSQPWPAGLADFERIFGEEFDLNQLGRVRISIMVGDRDCGAVDKLFSHLRDAGASIEFIKPFDPVEESRRLYHSLVSAGLSPDF